MTFLLHIENTFPTEVVDGSNESLCYSDEELDPNLKTGSLLQEISKKFFVKDGVKRHHNSWRDLGKKFFAPSSKLDSWFDGPNCMYSLVWKISRA